MMSRYRFGRFEFDAASGHLLDRGVSVALPAKARALLRLLLERAGETVATSDALHRLSPQRDIGDENVTQYVAQLRSALGDKAREPQFIASEYGRGYRFIAPLRSTDGDVDATPDLELLEAAYHLDHRSPRTLRLALRGFLKIASRDAGNWRALLGAAEASATLGTHLFDAPVPSFERAVALLELAKRLVGDSARAESIAGLIALFAAQDIDTAQVHCERALLMDPADVLAMRVLSRIFMVRKQWGQARLHLCEELRVRPDSIDAFVMLAVVQQYQRRPMVAAKSLQATCALNPASAHARYYLGSCLVEADCPSDAVEVLQSIRGSDRTTAVIASLGRAYAAAGRSGLARIALAALLRRRDREYVSPYLLATLHIALGDRRAALEAMTDARQWRDPWSIFLGVEPRFEGVRL